MVREIVQDGHAAADPDRLQPPLDAAEGAQPFRQIRGGQPGVDPHGDGGGGVEGWNDASETFNVTLELVRRGYTEEQIAKLWSGNLLRVMGEVERVARQLQAGQR